MIELMVVLLTFFWCGEQVSMFLLPLELMLFWGMGVSQMSHFILMGWSALVVGRWVVGAWCKKSYLGSAEMSSVVCVPG